MVISGIKTGKTGTDCEKGKSEEQKKKKTEDVIWKCSEWKKIRVWKHIQPFVQVAYFCFSKNTFYHRVQSQQRQVVFKNERTCDKNTSKTPERGEAEKKHLREPQTKGKQGKIQTMKRQRRSKASCWESQRGSEQSVAVWECVNVSASLFIC